MRVTSASLLSVLSTDEGLGAHSFASFSCTAVREQVVTATLKRTVGCQEWDATAQNKTHIPVLLGFPGLSNRLSAVSTRTQRLFLKDKDHCETVNTNKD